MRGGAGIYWELLAMHRALEQLWDYFGQNSELLHKGRAWDSMSTLLQLFSVALCSLARRSLEEERSHL